MKLFKSIVLTFFLFLFILTVSVVYRYVLWEREFVSNLSAIQCYEEDTEVREDINEKIEKFTLSDSRTEFVTFTVEEVLLLLFPNMKVSQNFNLNELCIIPERGLWTVYAKYSTDFVTLPWVRADVVKDNRETAELYVKKILVGDLNLPFNLGKKAVVEINRGISDAIILVNENEFLGRTIRNIELLEERLVIKGSIY
jgi:hypothetical protein